MSSTIEINKICEYCGKDFIARKSSTRFCSHQCSNRAYKKEKRQRHVDSQNNLTAAIKQDLEIGNQDYLTPSKCAILLGISRATLYRYLESGKIPCVQFQKKTLISRAVLDKMFENPRNISRKKNRLKKPLLNFIPQRKF